MYKCSSCDKGFNAAYKLKLHSRVHVKRKASTETQSEIPGERLSGEDDDVPAKIPKHILSKEIKKEALNGATSPNGDANENCIIDSNGQPESNENQVRTLTRRRSSLQRAARNSDVKPNKSGGGHDDEINVNETKDILGRSQTSPVKLQLQITSDGEDTLIGMPHKTSESIIENQVHISKLLNLKTYSCPECNATFSAPNLLKKHSCSPNQDCVFRCAVCNETFESETNLAVHQRTHLEKTRHKCKVCCKIFQSDSRLRVHMHSHSGEKPFKCDLCGKGFTQKGNCNVHRRRHMGKQPYKCKTCDARFLTNDKFKMHKCKPVIPEPPSMPEILATETANSEVKSEKRDNPYICEICSDTFAERDEFKRHKRLHAEQMPYTCSVCNKAFKKHYSLNAHKRVHNGAKPYECKKCGKQFNIAMTLKIHKCSGVGMETGVKPVDVTRKQKLPRNVIRTGKRMPYKCDVCNQSFVLLSSFNAHKRCHTDADSYKSFTQAVPRNRSIQRRRRHHVGVGKRDQNEKKFKCDVCQKRYHRPCRLRDHKCTGTPTSSPSKQECEPEMQKIAKIPPRGIYNTPKKKVRRSETLGKCAVCNETLNQSGQHVCQNVPKKSNQNLSVPGETLTEEAESTDSKLYICELCKKAYMYFSSLCFHKEIAHAEATEKNASVKMYEETVLQENVDEIVPEVNSTPSNSFSCDLCDRTFTTISNQRRHRRFHTDGRLFKGRKCAFPSDSPVMQPLSTNTVSSENSGNVSEINNSSPRQKPYTCETCDMTFLQREQFKHHKRLHAEHMPYTCNICDKGFAKHQSLNSHRKVHSHMLPYKCENCGEHFSHALPFKSHKCTGVAKMPRVKAIPGTNRTRKPIMQAKIRTGKKSLTCEYCDKMYSDEISLKLHRRCHKRGEQKFGCNICQKRFTRKDNMKVHMRIHTGERLYKCEVCRKSFVYRKSWKMHKCHRGGMTKPRKNALAKIRQLRVGRNIGNEVLTCKICLKAFTNISSLTMHTIRHNRGKKKTEAETRQATRQLSQRNPAVVVRVKTEMAAAEESNESGSGENHSTKPETRHKCETCNKVFRKQVTLELHMQSHAKEEPQSDSVNGSVEGEEISVAGSEVKDKMECNVCGKKFRQISNLRVHERLHTRERPYKCGKCGRSFNQNIQVKRHNCIPVVKPSHTCEICQKSFSHHFSLKIHQKIHLKMKPLRCEVCRKSFKRSIHLKMHSRVHSRVKPYKCVTCGDEFSVVEELVAHTRSHNREKPSPVKSENELSLPHISEEKVFDCDRCGEKFVSPENLESHNRIIEPPLKCELCAVEFTQSCSRRLHICTVKTEPECKKSEPNSEYQCAPVTPPSPIAETPSKELDVSPRNETAKATDNNTSPKHNSVVTEGSGSGLDGNSVAVTPEVGEPVQKSGGTDESYCNTNVVGSADPTDPEEVNFEASVPKQYKAGVSEIDQPQKDDVEFYQEEEIPWLAEEEIAVEEVVGWQDGGDKTKQGKLEGEINDQNGTQGEDSRNSLTFTTGENDQNWSIKFTMNL